jgi:hypothetical protein
VSSVQSIAGISRGGSGENILNVAAGANVTVGGSNINIGAGGFTLNITGGTLTAQRIFNNGSVSNSVVNINMSGGYLETTNRTLINETNPNSTLSSSFTMSGGTYFGSTGNFTLYGADADDRASFNIIGNAGTFNNNGRNLTLFNTGNLTDSTAAVNSATAVNFTFGTAPSITEVDTGALTLGNAAGSYNALTIDFSNIIRPGATSNYSSTLIDYTSLNSGGDFATPTFEGLNAGESAVLVHDATNKLYRVDFTLAAAPVPEPASLTLLGLGGLVMLPRRRNTRKAVIA